MRVTVVSGCGFAVFIIVAAFIIIATIIPAINYYIRKNMILGVREHHGFSRDI